MGRVIRCHQPSKSERREKAKQTVRNKKTKSGYGEIIPFERPSAKVITPRTDKQRILISTIKANALTFATGPGGTGKSHIGIAVGISMLLEEQVQRLILTAPDWCVGKSMGILPGGPEEKTAIIFSTLKEIVNKILGKSAAENLEKLEKIRYLHLSEALGKTFDDAFVLMDEAQVSSKEEMKVFLTRLGERSKIVLSGDYLEQAYRGPNNGLEDALNRFRGSPFVGQVNFSLKDVVRGDVCKAIIAGYRDAEVEED